MPRRLRQTAVARPAGPAPMTTAGLGVAMLTSGHDPTSASADTARPPPGALARRSRLRRRPSAGTPGTLPYSPTRWNAELSYGTGRPSRIQRFSAYAIQMPSLLSGGRRLAIVDGCAGVIASPPALAGAVSAGVCIGGRATGGRRVHLSGSAKGDSGAGTGAQVPFQSPQRQRAAKPTQQSRFTWLVRVQPSQLLQRRVRDERGAEVAQERRVAGLVRIESVRMCGRRRRLFA